MDFTLTSEVPVPKRRRATGGRYPFATMDVGQSFFAAGVKAESLLSCARRYAKASEPEARYTARAEGTGSRCWRVR